MSKTTRLQLDKWESGDTAPDLLAYFNSNADAIDAQCQRMFIKTRNPTVSDDDSLGYAVSDWWIDTGNTQVFLLLDDTTGAAVWKQIYPPTVTASVSGPGSSVNGRFASWVGTGGNTLADSGYSAGSFALLANGVTNGDSHDHAGGDGGTIAYSSLASIPSTFSPVAHASRHQSGGSDPIKLDDLAAADDNTDLNVSASAHGLCPKHPEDASKVLLGDGTWGSSPGGAGSSYWASVPGTPTRVSNTQFYITDTGHSNSYDLLFKKGTVLQWLESGNFRTAMVTASAYGSNTVTIDIVGSALAAGFSTMKYCMILASQHTFKIPGNLAVSTNPTGEIWRVPHGIYPLSVDFLVATAGTGTGANTADVYDDGVTIITTKPSLAAAATYDGDNAVDAPVTEIAEGSLVTAGIGAITATTPAKDAYIDLWYYPSSMRYHT